MNYFRQINTAILCNVLVTQSTTYSIAKNIGRCKIVNKIIYESLHTTKCLQKQNHIAKALRTVKSKSKGDTNQHLTDIVQLRAIGGKGGDGEISFLQLWVNDRAGPDGGDGGHGGHVVLQAAEDVTDLGNIDSLIRAQDGEKGYNKDCFGKNAEHTIVKVPVGTIVRDTEGKILADLDQIGMMFLAARGGAGGHGNTFFKSDTQQTPQVCEYGAEGEDLQYILEIKSMAHIGLIGLPNAGKSTLLRAVSRARPKVAAYPFTTLKPHIGMILYDDYEQIAMADLPGLISESHKNKGLGIQFLKHAERCAVLLFILDASLDEPWIDYETLRYEISQFNAKLCERPTIIAANKVDLPKAKENVEILKQKIDLPIVPISAKTGINISHLLTEIRILYNNVEKKASD